MKIAFFLGGMGGGGAERVISILSRDYAERGWETDIGALLLYRNDYELHENTRFLNFTGDSTSRWKKVPYWLKAIRSYVKTEKPDIIVSFFSSVSALVMPACIGLGVPIIVSERSDPRYEPPLLPVKWIVNIFYPKTRAVVFQTEGVKRCFRKAIREKGYVIPNPVRVTTVASENPQKKIATANQLVAGKNHKLLIEAFQKVHEKEPEYHLWIYGAGELMSDLIAYRDSLHLTEYIHLPGRRSDIHEQLRDAEMFVLSSDYEGLSNALLEAMMMGLPCVTTDSFDLTGVMENEKNGLIVPRRDPNALANAMLRLIRDRGLEKKLSENARASAEKFQKKNVMKLWRTVIEGET